MKFIQKFHNFQPLFPDFPFLQEVADDCTPSQLGRQALRSRLKRKISRGLVKFFLIRV